MDGLALNQALLVPQGAAKVGFLNHGHILGALAGCLLLQAADLGHGLGVLGLHDEVTLGWRAERKELVGHCSILLPKSFNNFSFLQERKKLNANKKQRREEIKTC